MMTAKPQRLLRLILNVLTGANKALVELPNQELVGINDDPIAQNQFGESKTLNIATAQVSGEILSVSLIATEDDAGRGGIIIKEPADIYIFRSTLTINAGDEIFTKAQAALRIGHIHIPEGDWAANMNGTDTAGSSYTPAAFPFQTDSSGNLYLVYVHRGGTTINSVAGDDEQIEANFLIELRD